MKITRYILTLSVLLSVEQLHAQDYLAIDSYKCSDFLSDSAKPDDAQKLIRSLVMIAWATGFAAAHQQKEIRADIKAMQLIAVMTGDACRKNPDKTSVEVMVETIKKYVAQ